MRLLFLSNLYPPFDLGGFEQWCHEVAIRLRQRGHTVQVLTSRYGADRPLPPEQDVTRTLYLEANVHHYHPWDFIRRNSQERANERELRQAIDRFAPDLVVIWGMWNLSRNLPCRAEEWLPGRVAYYLASYWPIDPDAHHQYWQLPAEHRLTELLKKPLRRRVLTRLAREGYPPSPRFEHAMCCSRYVRDTLVQSGRLPAHTGVLFGGIDPQPFQISPAAQDRAGDSPLRLLYFGSLLPHKGVHTAIEALGNLKARGLNDHLELTILGSGHPDYLARLQALVVRLDLGDRVRFADRIPRQEIPSYLSQFDIFLFTSIWPEPMARSVMEAMAAGLLVIGSEVGGQTEMLFHGKNGLTFRAGDADGLADQIAYAVTQPELRRQLAQAGRQMVLEQFTLDRMVAEIEEWLQSIVPQQ